MREYFHPHWGDLAWGGGGGIVGKILYEVGRYIGIW